MNHDHILFFDGVCNLCQSAVQFVIKRNAKKNVLFCSLQSDIAKTTLAQYNIDSSQTKSIVYLCKGKAHVKSSAALYVSKQLNGLWPMVFILVAIPPFIRNTVYNWVAKNRYKWYGKKETCWLPAAEWSNRFL